MRNKPEDQLSAWDLRALQQDWSDTDYKYYWIKAHNMLSTVPGSFEGSVYLSFYYHLILKIKLAGVPGEVFLFKTYFE